MFQYLSGNSPNQHLVMGPTAHCREGTETLETSVGDRTVGDGRFDYVTLVTRWFDRWLKDDLSAPELPAVQYYVLNSGEWKAADAWPPPGGRPMRLYLSSGGHANSAGGDGTLVARESARGEVADEFIDDPMHPVPSLGGSCCSDQVARDQSAVEARQDVLVYSSDAFSETTRIVGDVTVTLYVSSSAPDTDVMVKLIDVDTAGPCVQSQRHRIASAVPKRRCRCPAAAAWEGLSGQTHRHGHGRAISCRDTDCASRWRAPTFPNYERNLNSGGSNVDETAAHIARTRILHDAHNPSVVEFSTLPR